MNKQTKRKINNIVKLVRKRRILLQELNDLSGYKEKIEQVKQKYAGEVGGSKT